MFRIGGISDIYYNSALFALPVKHQKTMLQLISEKQNGAKMVFGPFGIINRELFQLVSHLENFPNNPK